MKKLLLTLLALASISSFAKSITMYDCTYERDNGFEGHLVIGNKLKKDSYDYNGKYLEVELVNEKVKMTMSTIEYGMYPNIDALKNTVSTSVDKDFNNVVTMFSDGVLLGCKKEVINL